LVAICERSIFLCGQLQPIGMFMVTTLTGSAVRSMDDSSSNLSLETGLSSKLSSPINSLTGVIKQLWLAAMRKGVKYVLSSHTDLQHLEARIHQHNQTQPTPSRSKNNPSTGRYSRNCSYQQLPSRHLSQRLETVRVAPCQTQPPHSLLAMRFSRA
jgi:hypothetical protein